MGNIKETVLVKRVILKVIGEAKSQKYLKDDDIDNKEIGSIYQIALAELLNGKTEKAIRYILCGLEIERNNKQLLHLCNTMLFSVNDYILESDIESFKKKNLSFNLKDIELKLKKDVKELNEKIKKDSKELDALNKELEESKKKFFIIHFLKKSKLLPLINKLTKVIDKNKEFLAESSADLSKASKLLKVEEYARVLGIIIEYHAFPSKFDWVIKI